MLIFILILILSTTKSRWSYSRPFETLYLLQQVFGNMFHYVDWDSQHGHCLLVYCLWAAWGGPATSAICDPSEFLSTMGLVCISEVRNRKYCHIHSKNISFQYVNSSLVPRPLPDLSHSHGETWLWNRIWEWPGNELCAKNDVAWNDIMYWV